MTSADTTPTLAEAQARVDIIAAERRQASKRATRAHRDLLTAAGFDIAARLKHGRIECSVAHFSEEETDHAPMTLFAMATPRDSEGRTVTLARATEAVITLELNGVAIPMRPDLDIDSAYVRQVNGLVSALVVPLAQAGAAFDIVRRAHIKDTRHGLNTFGGTLRPVPKETR